MIYQILENILLINNIEKSKFLLKFGYHLTNFKAQQLSIECLFNYIFFSPKIFNFTQFFLSFFHLNFKFN